MSYRLLTTMLLRIYPSRREPVPESIKSLLLKASTMRGYPPVDPDRLLVHSTSRFAHPDRSRESRSLKDDPDARFFVEQNPDFEQFYMLLWVPLDFGNLARGAGRMPWRQLLGGGRAKA
jgi:hypothetical protein